MNSMIRRYSLKPEETVAHAKRILESNLRHYDGLRMRWITVLENDERGRNALCLIKAVPKGRRPAAEEGRKYKYVHLLEAWLEPAQLLAILEQGGACPLDFAGEPTPFNPQAQFSEIEHLPSSNDYSPYPGYLFQSRGGGCFTITAEPLLSYNLAFAPTPFAAMSDWCECLRPISSSDGRIGEILIRSSSR